MIKNIGTKIKYMRHKKGISQYALARAAGISQSTLSYIEKGAKQPRFETLQAVCTALDITLFELFACGEDASTTRFFREACLSPAAPAVSRNLEANLYALYFKGTGFSPECRMAMHESEQPT